MALKVGIAGFGTYFGTMWAVVFNACSRTNVTALCDLRAEAAQAAADRIGGGEVFTSFDDLLASDVDAVGVFTPGPLHCEHVVAALEAGKHVLSAVPTAWSLDECQQLIDAVERTGKKYMLAETPTFDPYVAVLRDRVASGEMGEVFLVESGMFQDLSGPLIGTDYFSQVATPDGLNVTAGHSWRYGIPPLYYIEHSIGPVLTVLNDRLVEVTAQGSGRGDAGFERIYGTSWESVYGNPYTCETALFRTARGTTIKITVAFVVATGVDEDAPIHYWGDKRSCVIGGGEARLLTRDSVTPLEIPDPTASLEPALRELGPSENSPVIVDLFARCIADDTPPPVDIHKAVSFMAAGLCGHQSAMEGRTIQIPDFT